MATASIDTPLGRYVLVAGARGPTHFQPAGSPSLARAIASASNAAAERALERALYAFAAYFAGTCSALDALEIDPGGSDFQQRIWRALRAIPAGATAGYGEIARRIGRPGAARAVGCAHHHNPIAIAIPCHRVIGADGRLVGYAGGIERKRWLLAHEAAHLSDLRSASPRCARPEAACAHAASLKSNGREATRLARALARSRDSAAASI